MLTFDIEYTDTFSGEANYSWLRRATVSMPDMTHYGYTGSADGSYSKADKVFRRELMRKAKAAIGLTGCRGVVSEIGETIEFRPARSATVMFITYREV